VFEWDGSIGGSVPTAYAEPGLYTYEVVATQLDSNGPDLQVQDSTCYRSSFLHLVRSQDEFLQPIYEVEFDHYDDKGTPEEEDDDFVYLVRYYSLVDEGNKNAGEGMLKLYDPDMQLVTSWNVMSLQDLAATNGLLAGTTAVEHRLLVPVLARMMDVGGTYRFVLHVVDDHAVDYRDHRLKRPAFDLNGRKTEQPIIYIADGKWHIVWCRRRFQHIIVRDIELYPKPGRVRPAMEFAKAEYTPNGFVVAAINGGFFATANPHDITGEVGVGSAQWAFEGNPIPIYRGDRYCFGMRNASDYFGYSKLAPNSRKTGLMAPLPFKEMYPYGLTGVGLLVRNGQTKTAPVGWPWGLEQYTDTARTAVAWSEKGDLLLVVTDGANWRQTAEYVAALPDLIDAKCSIRKDDDKIGIIKAAFMLDGSGSSQLGYCWRDAGGAVREQGSMAPADNRPIRNIIRVMALCK